METRGRVQVFPGFGALGFRGLRLQDSMARVWGFVLGISGGISGASGALQVSGCGSFGSWDEP